MAAATPGKQTHEPYNIDALGRNADWTKRTWDLHGTPEQQAAHILGNARTQEARQAALDRFLETPAARALPAETRHALQRLGLSVPAPKDLYRPQTWGQQSSGKTPPADPEPPGGEE